MLQFNFYIGTTSQGEVDMPTERIREMAIKTIREHYPSGHSFTPLQGGWVNADGDYINEPSLMAMVLCNDIAKGKAKAKAVRDRLQIACHQEEVLLTCTMVEVL